MFKALYHRAPRSRAYHTHLSLFLTFLLVGAWHGTTWAFVVCGFILAIGAVVNESWPKVLTRVIGKERLKRLNKAFVYQCLCFGLTFAFLSLAFIPFWMPDLQYFSLLPLFAHPAGIAAFVALWAVATGYIAVLRIGEGVVAPLTQRLVDAVGRVITPARTQVILLAIVINIIVLAALLNVGLVQAGVYQTY